MDRLLPIGSVIRAHGEDDLLMIIGFYPETEGYSYDYLACLYPQGLFESPVMAVLNEGDIESILFEGYQDESGERALNAAMGYMHTMGEMNKAAIHAAIEFASKQTEEVEGQQERDDEEPFGEFRLG